MDRKYGCVLLAGGSGSRMGGRNKAELEYDRVKFAERIEAELSKLGIPCYISAAAYEQDVPEGWALVRDTVTGEDGSYIGPAGGIYSCLVRAEQEGLDGLFFVPCDAPFYSADIHRQLALHIDEDTKAACFQTSDGRMQTTFGWYSVRCTDTIEEDISSGKFKLVRMVVKMQGKIIRTAEAGLDDSLFSNINNAEDYRELRNMKTRSGSDSKDAKGMAGGPVSLEDAVASLTAAVHRIQDSEEISLSEASGRTLAEDITAFYDQPPFPRSPLDGYALRAADTSGASEQSPAVLKVITEVDAGHCYDGTVGHGEAVRIMTGAPIPEGADAVIGQEDTDYGEDDVRIYTELKPHQNYCDQGEDYKAGTVLISDREYIGPVQAGIIASTGRNKVRAVRRPRVLLISTGDEVTSPGEELAPGKIYDSNLYTVAAQLGMWGVCVTEMMHFDDDADALIRAVEDRIDDADIVITTGGVSVGKKDILHDVHRKMGVRRLFWKIGIKPGMAMLSGLYKGKPILSLSGNPYAAYINLHLVVRPVIDALNGNNHLSMIRSEAVLADDYGKASPTRRFVRAWVQEGKAFIEGHTGGNGDIYSGHGTNALLDLPAGSDRLNAGDTVKVLYI